MKGGTFPLGRRAEEVVDGGREAWKHLGLENHAPRLDAERAIPRPPQAGQIDPVGVELDVPVLGDRSWIALPAGRGGSEPETYG